MDYSHIIGGDLTVFLLDQICHLYIENLFPSIRLHFHACSSHLTTKMLFLPQIKDYFFRLVIEEVGYIVSSKLHNNQLHPSPSLFLGSMFQQANLPQHFNEVIFQTLEFVKSEKRIFHSSQKCELELIYEKIVRVLVTKLNSSPIARFYGNLCEELRGVQPCLTHPS